MVYGSGNTILSSASGCDANYDCIVPPPPPPPTCEDYSCDYSCPTAPNGCDSNLCVDPCDTSCVAPPTCSPCSTVQIQEAVCVEPHQYNCPP